MLQNRKSRFTDDEIRELYEEETEGDPDGGGKFVGKDGRRREKCGGGARVLPPKTD